MIRVRDAVPEDTETLGAFREALWPDGSSEEHATELAEYFAGRARESLTVLVAEGEHGTLLGFIELSIHPYAEGCSSTDVGYVEGWYVVPEMRGRGIGRELIRSAEKWAREQGCSELASDAAADNDASAAAHRATGFQEVGLVRCFRKDL